MSGIPRPVTDLPNGSVSVRLVRETLANNITGHAVELHVGSNVLTARTDEAGRAQFDKLTPGATVKAVAVVDGERLESQEFLAPAEGGIRLLLVATGASRKAEARAPAVAGQVILGSQSRIVIEPGDETVAVYYLLELVNNARTPVNTTKPFAFRMPAGAIGPSLLQGSSPLAVVRGIEVQVNGPFSPGTTPVQVGFELPENSGSLAFTQPFPVALGQFGVIVKKVGDTRLSSPDIVRQQDMTADGQVYIAASGGPVAADHPLSLSLTDLPHHSAAPRRIALALAIAIALAGAWAATRAPRDARAAAERARLISRRERLLNELVRLEHEHRKGRTPEPRYSSRREEIVAALEHVYGALDSDDAAPDPSTGAGVAA